MTHDVLIVDDEADIRGLLADILQDEGYSARLAANGVEAIAEISKRRPALVILDIWLGESERDGLRILELIKRDHPHVPVIMISGHGTIETAVSAIKKGAYDFIEKPFQTERLLLILERALASARLKRENLELKAKAPVPSEIIGTSSAMNQVRQTIERAAPTNSRVFITAPLGSGKEVVARQLHEYSLRAKGPFVNVNCSLIHPDRLEAELFGTEIVGLSADTPRQIGLLEQAHNGTLYLDEITELSLATQSKLIRMLQDGAFVRIGGQQKIEVDVRVIATSSGPIERFLKEGKFREDLYYRLAVVPIHVPPLNQRISDIPLLAQAFMEKAALAQGVPARKFSEEALIILQSYSWPGNVRQLRNVIDWILIMNSGDPKESVQSDMLPPEICAGIPFVNNWAQAAEIVTMPLREAREAFEREYLLAQVNRFGGNISQTARFVGMERSALHRKLKALGAHEARYGNREDVEESLDSLEVEGDTLPLTA